MQDSSKKAVLLVGQNLFFLGRIEAAAEPLGYQVRRATTEPAFRNQLDGPPPDLILVDLEGDESTWVGALEVLKERKPVSTQVIAFGPHEQVATLERARTLGCDLVLNKGEFNRDLAKILAELGSSAGK
ncbi:MAG: response regulator [Chloroflexi bacterium]|nr:response regulator [Chloroflexota bacterium]